MSTLSHAKQDDHLKDAFFAKINESGFPCVGAKSAAANGLLNFERAQDLRSDQDDKRLHKALVNWAGKAGSNPQQLRSFGVIFEQPGQLNEAQFEKAMWQRIQALSDEDVRQGYAYDPEVSADPANSDFSVSFGGKAYFIIGLHPEASRPARRFIRPALIFNAHDQFELLKDKGKFDRMRSCIMERDLALAGTVNPMLATHGEVSAAPQYSGRQVGKNWMCPFKDKRG